MAAKMAEEFLLGLMEMYMKGNLEITKWKELVFLSGETSNMKGNGMTAKWMDKENSDGMMEENILELIKMIKKMATENSIGQMANIIKEIGKMADNTE